jgi:hypothetical protein
MNQTHFLDTLFQKIKTGKKKGQLREIRFRKRPDRYGENATRTIQCRDCGNTMAQVRNDASVVSGTCFFCHRRKSEILVEAMAEQGARTRRERRAFARSRA